MNCEEIEEKIYLFDELTEPERGVVATHVASCSRCRETLTDYQQLKQITALLSAQQSTARNAAALTSRIIAAIQPKQSWNDKLVVAIRETWWKFSLTAVSAALVLFFMIEQNQSAPTATAHELKSGTVLNTQLLFQQQRKQKKNEVSVYERYSQLKKDQQQETL